MMDKCIYESADWDQICENTDCSIAKENCPIWSGNDEGDLRVVDMQEFEFITRRPYGRATITVYASGFVSVSGKIGTTLDKTIDFAISKDGKQVIIRNGYVFKTTPNGRIETTSRTFSSKKISARLDVLGITFPAYYHCEQQGDCWVGTLEENE